jgi:hypothetical protein
MANWGTGIFDNDGALEFLAQVTGKMVNTIEENLRLGHTLAMPDAHARILPAVAILIALKEKFNFAPPNPDKVTRWKNDFLDYYLDKADEKNIDPQEVNARRELIIHTFDQLLNLSHAYWDKIK